MYSEVKIGVDSTGGGCYEIKIRATFKGEVSREEIGAVRCLA